MTSAIDAQAMMRATIDELETYGDQLFPEEYRGLETAEDTEKKTRSFRTAKNMKDAREERPAPLIDGVLPSEVVSVFAGTPGIGKSFVALDWAIHIANGIDWNGFSVQEPRTVAYIAGEGWDSFGDRIEQWEETHGEEVSDRLVFLDGSLEHIDMSVDGMEEFIRLKAKAEDVNPDLIIFDTFSMLAGVNSENDNAEIAQVFTRAQRLKAEMNTTVMFIHHLSKDGRQIRGASTFLGNVDTAVIANREKNMDWFYLSTEGEEGGKQRAMEPRRINGFHIDSPGVLLKYTEDELRLKVAKPDKKKSK
jgi:RecA-family ATPase